MVREHYRQEIPREITGEEFYTKWLPLGNSQGITSELPRNGESTENHMGIPGEFPGNG